MGLVIVTPPAEEPISLTEAKLHLRVDHSADDTLISSLITAARQYVETATRRQLVTATWKQSLDCFPGSRCIKLPLPPVQSVSSITYYDSAGSQETWNSSNYTVDVTSEPARICLVPNASFPEIQTDRANAIEITFAAGYGAASSVPDALKAAMKLIVAHLYENREAVVTGTIATQLPLAVDSLLRSQSWGSYV